MPRFGLVGVFAVTVCACALLAACAQQSGQVAATPGTPGWTGRTVVPGSTSTIAGDAEATYQQQKWPFSTRQ